TRPEGGSGRCRTSWRRAGGREAHRSEEPGAPAEIVRARDSRVRRDSWSAMKRTGDSGDPRMHEVIVVGGGIAGLSAAIDLGRAQRDVLVIDSGHSMAKWEPVVQNYLGFPNGVGGEELL